jgi:hypothetical protein
VLDSATHCACISVKDGKTRGNSIRVRRDVFERVISTPITEVLRADELIKEMAAEIRRHYVALMADAGSETTRRSAAVLELDGRTAAKRRSDCVR